MSISSSTATPIQVVVPIKEKSCAEKEATETPDETRRRAVHGDQDAVRKLAKQEAKSEDDKKILNITS